MLPDHPRIVEATKKLEYMVNPVTRTSVKLTPPLLRGPEESKAAFISRMSRFSDAFDAMCKSLWTFPYCNDPEELVFSVPEFMKTDV